MSVRPFSPLPVQLREGIKPAPLGSLRASPTNSFRTSPTHSFVGKPQSVTGSFRQTPDGGASSRQRWSDYTPLAEPAITWPATPSPVAYSTAGFDFGAPFGSFVRGEIAPQSPPLSSAVALSPTQQPAPVAQSVVTAVAPQQAQPIMAPVQQMTQMMWVQVPVQAQQAQQVSWTVAQQQPTMVQLQQPQLQLQQPPLQLQQVQQVQQSQRGDAAQVTVVQSSAASAPSAACSGILLTSAAGRQLFGEALDPNTLDSTAGPTDYLGHQVPIPSVGSALHGSGRCNPCAWFWKPRGCQNAANCTYCHLCPEGELKSRKKAKVAAIRMGALEPSRAGPGGAPCARANLKLTTLLQ